MKIFKIFYYILIAFIVAVALLLIVSVFPITGKLQSDDRDFGVNAINCLTPGVKHF